MDQPILEGVGHHDTNCGFSTARALKVTCLHKRGRSKVRCSSLSRLGDACPQTSCDHVTSLLCEVSSDLTVKDLMLHADPLPQPRVKQPRKRCDGNLESLHVAIAVTNMHAPGAVEG